MDELIKYVLNRAAEEMEIDPESKLKILIRILTEFLKEQKHL